MLKIKSIFILSLLMLCMLATTGTAQEEIFFIGEELGVGARAMGMGGAFIAVADDATAASWNPGGLVQLERPEFSVVGTYGARQNDYSSGSRGIDASSTDQEVSLNYLSAALPLPRCSQR